MKSLFCPFALCTQHERADKPAGWTSSCTARDHLKQGHREELHLLTDDQLENLGIYMCRQCDDHIAVDKKNLERHIEKKHVNKRATTNLDIVTNHLFKTVESHQKNHWKQGLTFLRNHRFKPATFRQTLMTLIKF